MNAIRSKDPRVYDKKINFYTEFKPDDVSTSAPKDKPMYLKDYHRQNFLEGAVNAEEEEPKTYVQEQQELKDTIIKEMHGAADEEDEDASDDEGGFLVRKSKPQEVEAAPLAKAPDVEDADKDPETFLSNFMASRAWVPPAGSELHPFESDDDEEDARAEAFEQAYNMRFEDPEHTNENLMTHSRTAAAEYSVRRDKLSGRKKARELERLKKEDAKREKNEEKARLKKLKIEEMEEKVKKIRQSAGLGGKVVNLEEWKGMLDGDWDDEKWEQEMNKRFDQGYYAEKDDAMELASDEERDGKSTGKRQKVKPPTWDDDIDIKDLVPDFEDDDEKPDFTLSSDDEGPEAENGIDDAAVENGDETVRKTNAKQKKKERLRSAAEKKQAAKRDRRIIETLVDQNLDVDMSVAESSTNGADSSKVLFRYRETSPTSFGLTPLDILSASDAQLNQYVGLKKLAAFRDPERKRKDKKRLSKKARLREWRRDVFEEKGGARKHGGKYDKTKAEATEDGDKIQAKEATVNGEGKKKRKRSRKAKATIVEA